MCCDFPLIVVLGRSDANDSYRLQWIRRAVENHSWSGLSCFDAGYEELPGLLLTFGAIHGTVNVQHVKHTFEPIAGPLTPC